MTTSADKKKCECRVCQYGKVVRDLIHRTKDDADKKLIEELYDNLIHAEDDRDFYLTCSEGCDIKHGGISFTDSLHAIEARRTKDLKGPE